MFMKNKKKIVVCVLFIFIISLFSIYIINNKDFKSISNDEVNKVNPLEYKYSSLFSNYAFYNPQVISEVENIILSPEKAIIGVGRSMYIDKLVEPINAIYDYISWSSSNSEIVTIDETGKITGVAPGKATITAKINDVIATTEVYVYEIKANTYGEKLIDDANNIIEAIITNKDLSSTDLTSDTRASALKEIENGAINGDTFNVNIKYSKVSQDEINELEKEIKSSYSDYSVATAKYINLELSHKDADGLAHHIANITKLENNIDLIIDYGYEIPSSTISGSKREYVLIRKENDTIEQINFNWTGYYQIRHSANKFSYYILLYKDIYIPLTGIETEKKDVTLNIGEQERIQLIYYPADATSHAIKSYSSNPKVASVDNYTIIAKTPGNAVITVETEDGGFRDYINVTVKSPLNEIYISGNSRVLDVGETNDLTVIYSPENTTDDRTVTWISRNTDIATVKDGKVTAVGPGYTIITARVGDKTDQYGLTVKSPLKSISLNKTSTTINVGEYEDLTVIYNPINTTDDKNVIWSSSDNSIVRVNNGEIIGISKGEATITARVGEKTAECKVEVKNPLKSISLNKAEGELDVGASETLIVSYNPDNTPDDKTVTWSSSDINVATVIDGKVTAIGKGEAIITARVGDKTATYKLTVNIPVTSITLNKTSGTLNVGETEELIVSINPIDTTYDITVTWTSNFEDIATVKDGKVTAIAPGKVTITAKVQDKIATFELTVLNPLNNIYLAGATSGTLNVWDHRTLVIYFDPLNTTDDRTIIWTSSDTSVATVSSDGDIAAVGAGVAIITARVGDKSVSYTLTVKSPLKSISLNKQGGLLKVGETEILTVIFNRSDTTDDKTVTWTSSDTSIATVVNGKVTALKVGNAIITAKVGNMEATYSLTVLKRENLKASFLDNYYKIKNSFVHGFKLNENLTDIRNKLDVNCLMENGKTIIATGVTFRLNSEAYTSVVYGDLNGDGKINSADLLKMRQHLLGTSILTGPYLEAGMIAKGKTINSADLLKLRHHLLGLKQIEQ